MKILVVEDESELREMVVFLLESKFDAEVIEAPSGNRAIELLKGQPDIECVICDYNMSNGNGGEVFKYLESSRSTIPFFLCSADGPDQYPEFKEKKPEGSIRKPMVFEPLKATIQNLINTGRLKPRILAEVEGQFCRIRLRTLLKMGLVACDLYMKLSEDKYIKTLNKGDVLSEDDIQRYSLKNVDFLHLKKSDSNVLLDKFANDVLAISRSSNFSTEYEFEISQATLELVQDLSRKLGMTKEIKKLAQASVELAVKTILKTPGYLEFMEVLLKNPDRYVLSHSIALAFVSCGLASLLGLKEPESFSTLAMASVLHDVTIGNEKLAEFQSLDELQSSEALSGFSYEELKQYREHPVHASELVKPSDGFNPEIGKLLLTHHELPNGQGFPNGVPPELISLLSAIFILGHDLVTQTFRNKGKCDMAVFMERAEKKYQTGNFLKAYKALPKVE